MTDKHVKKLEGSVVSTKMQDTVVVEVTRLKKHPQYGKYIRVSKRYKADSKGMDIAEGARVTIEHTRPTSKDKCWKVVSEVENG